MTSMALQAPAHAKIWAQNSCNEAEFATSEGSSRKARGIFGYADTDEIKRKVRHALIRPDPYDVSRYYKTSGCAQAIARSVIFEQLTLFVIAVNALYIAIDTDWNKDTPMHFGETRSLPESPPFFVFMENIFCIYFLGEWIIRFMAFEHKKNCMRDGWFVFDSILLAIMVLETWCFSYVWVSGEEEHSLGSNTAVLRLIRLLRLSRLMRMLRSMPDLMILIKGMSAAMTSVFYVMCLLLMITYVFGIVFTQLSQGNPYLGMKYFSSVPHSMYSLLIYLTLLDSLAGFLEDLRENMWPLLCVSLVFICLAALTVMNMLIGVLCEVVSSVANTEKESLLALHVAEKLKTVLDTLDTDDDNLISYEEFTKIIDKPEALHALEAAGVNPLAVVDIAELIFFDNEEPVDLTFETFMNMIMDMRDTNPATVKDVVNIWKQIKTTTNRDLAQLQSNLTGVTEKLDQRTGKLEWQLNCALDVLGQIAAKLDVPLS